MEEIIIPHAEDATTEIPTQKIYKLNAIRVGTFLGGPLVAGYFIAQNFKVFKEPGKIKATWIISIAITVFVFGGALMLQNPERIPRYIIPLIYTSAAYFIAQSYQSRKMAKHISAGGQSFYWGRIIVVSLIGMLVTIVPFFAIAYFSDANNTDTVKTYGTVKHEVIFNKENISEAEIDKIAEGLTKSVFFDDAVQKSTYVTKDKTTYRIAISCNSSVKNNGEALAFFVQLQKDMQALFPGNKIIINLVVDSWDNVVKRIE
jgi:hypothetical protein